MITKKLFILKKEIIYLFYIWLCWVFVAACRLSLAAVSRAYSTLQKVGFSLRWFLQLKAEFDEWISFFHLFLLVGG